MTKERRKHWDREHQAVVARTTEAIAAAENSKAAKPAGTAKTDEDKGQAAQQAKLRKAELQSRLELLQAVGEKHDDAGEMQHISVSRHHLGSEAGSKCALSRSTRPACKCC